MRAEAAGDPGPWRQLAILGHWDWDAEAQRDIVRDYVEHLADDDDVLVIDDTGSQTGQSVMRSGTTIPWKVVNITNCQIGVFATYVWRHGHAFIDRVLHLSKKWTDDPESRGTQPRKFASKSKEWIATTKLLGRFGASSGGIRGST
ncbi:transposase [Bradyrhizobium sp. SSUT77]|uniref:transposase n=1 Tax=Bradyrhizobium sp. SSUT77 TaxID=3040603 RepID=UPI00244A009B|nr:transposase [Bradyrhizobium sp. SSUT77]MDH2347718.1 transposase [Bradyrhizobium sp. SSUT77]